LITTPVSRYSCGLDPVPFGLSAIGLDEAALSEVQLEFRLADVLKMSTDGGDVKIFLWT
jgi:hypothetical protein